MSATTRVWILTACATFAIAAVNAVNAGDASAQSADVDCDDVAGGPADPDDNDREPAAPGAGKQPWMDAVSPERREKARALMLEGNRLIKVPLFARAADRYQEALAIWRHPAFYYNLGIAQLNLIQPVQAYESFRKALCRGQPPLGRDKFQQAQDYIRNLEEQLARVEVECAIPGTDVTLDGELLFVGPGRRIVMVSPGRHQLVASKPGHIPDAEPIALSAGDRVAYTLSPPSVDDVARRERRWATWKPWAVVGAGAALTALGGYFDWSSTKHFDAFDEGFAARCGARGCQESAIPDLTPELTRAERQQTASFALYIAGGAALATGAVLLYFNRERLVESEDRSLPAVTLAPIVSPTAGGVTARIRF